MFGFVSEVYTILSLEAIVELFLCINHNSMSQSHHKNNGNNNDILLYQQINKNQYQNDHDQQQSNGDNPLQVEIRLSVT